MDKNVTTASNIQTPSKALLSTVAGLLIQARSIAVLTGAGISKESGIPTFRDAMSSTQGTGLWDQYRPEDLASKEGFLKDPATVWQRYDHRRNGIWKTTPNNGHHALVALERWCQNSDRTFTLITQNVDNLHEVAGSQGILHLHGSIFNYKRLNDDVPFDLDTLDETARQACPPKCPETGSYIRPDVVWFGEMLPADILNAASASCQSCDVMLVIGTSGVVYPAAGLPASARQHGAVVIEINPVESELTGRVVDHFLKGPSGSVLPALMTALKTQEDKEKPEGSS